MLLRRQRCCHHALDLAVASSTSSASAVLAHASPSTALCSAHRRAIVKEPDFERVQQEQNVYPTKLAKYDQGFYATKVETKKKAYGVSFLVTEEQELEEATKHHNAVVTIHERKRYMMPFWFISVAAAGNFRASMQVKSPTHKGREWMELQTATSLSFTYPFGDHHRFNQISASYLHDQEYVEACLADTNTPSLLISRFELLEELQVLESPPTLIPFVMSSTTAYNICRGRLTRDIILTKMKQELVKNYGRMRKSSINMSRCDVIVEKLRPVFLPMTKMVVSTASQPTKLPLFINGFSGKAAGPVLTDVVKKRLYTGFGAGAVTILTNAPYVEPIIAISYGVLAGLLSVGWRHVYRVAKVKRALVQSEKRLVASGLIHYKTDQKGYRWTVEDEEKYEYEYREELRFRHFKKTEFEERVREETVRDDARRNAKFNASKRQRNDIANADPLGLYALLGLQGRETASAKEIADAFREAARVNHPDLQPGADEGEAAGAHEEAHKKMQRILEAYRILKNSKKRKEYDCGLITSKDVESL